MKTIELFVNATLPGSLPKDVTTALSKGHTEVSTKNTLLVTFDNEADEKAFRSSVFGRFEYEDVRGETGAVIQVYTKRPGMLAVYANGTWYLVEGQTAWKSVHRFTKSQLGHAHKTNSQTYNEALVTLAKNHIYI